MTYLEDRWCPLTAHSLKHHLSFSCSSREQRRMPYFHHFLAESSTMNNKCCNLAQQGNNNGKNYYWHFCPFFPCMNQNLTEGRGIKTWLLLDILLIGWKTTFVRLLIYGFLIIIYFAWMDCCSAPLWFCSRFISFCECIEISRFPKESDAMLNFLSFFVQKARNLVVQKVLFVDTCRELCSRNIMNYSQKKYQLHPAISFFMASWGPWFFFKRKERYTVSMSVRVKKLFQSFNLLRKK